MVILPENGKRVAKTLFDQYWSYEVGKRNNPEILNNTMNTDNTEAG